jgi:PIN domain nuclease of toxin-antitoxin system
VILLDTHIWVWWVARPDRLQVKHRDLLERGADRVFSPQIVVESTQLPQPFHRDPADQLLVATARVLQCSIMTEDNKIESYPHVRLA